MFLLPLAERHRRSLLLGLLLGALILQSWLPWQPLQTFGKACLAPVAAITMPLAGRVVDRVDPRRPADEIGGATSEFIEVERQQGQPQAVAGVAWLEIPVFEHRRLEHKLILAAGANYGLAVDMPVIFGRIWLGRLVEVKQYSAVVQLETSAAVPTSVLLQSADGSAPLRAVVEGRGNEGAPLLRWIENRADPKDAAPVLWRASAEDLPGLAQLGLRLGLAAFAGDVQRGAGFWQVDFVLPAGAGGRVFVPAGAVAESTVAEPQIDFSTAQLALRVDGVFGAQLCGLRTLHDGIPSVVLNEQTVLGKVVAQRGNLLWCSLQPPRAWQNEALRLSDLGVVDPDPVQLYSRGDSTLPRGLPLGSVDAVAPVPGDKFWALTRVPLPVEDAEVAQ